LCEQSCLSPFLTLVQKKSFYLIVEALHVKYKNLSTEMAEKVKINRSEDRPIVVFDEPSERRLPGRDLVDEDDEDDVEADVAPKSIEIIEDNSNSHIRPRKSSLLVNPTSHRHQARKRSVTFDPVDVAAIIQPPPKTPTDEEVILV
jgi:hypothetical protein